MTAPTESRPSPSSSSTPDSTPSRIDVGHSRLGYRRIGKGPDVLFVHGWPLHGATFRHIVDRLRGDFTCHLIDLPGTGDSEWDAASKISMGDHVESVARAVDALGLSRYALVAHDSGGLIARWVAARHGDRVTGIVLGNTEIPGHHPPLIDVFARLFKLPGGGALIASLMRSDLVRKSPLGFGGCFHDKRLIGGEFAELFVDPLVGSKRTAAGQLRLLAQFDWSLVDRLPTAHATLRAPVKLVWGAEDRWFPADKARGMLSQFGRGAEMVEISPAKLFVHEEYPERFADETRAFLAPLFAAS